MKNYLTKITEKKNNVQQYTVFKIILYNKRGIYKSCNIVFLSVIPINCINII